MPILLESNLVVGAFILFAIYCFFVFPRVMDPTASSRLCRFLAVAYLGLLCIVFSGTLSWRLSAIQESLLLFGLVCLGAGFLFYAKRHQGTSVE